MSVIRYFATVIFCLDSAALLAGTAYFHPYWPFAILSLTSAVGCGFAGFVLREHDRDSNS